MTEVSRCIIIGTSHAGVQQAFALRKRGWSGEIVLIGADPRHPYHRPPLSKDYLTGTRTLDQIQLRPLAMYEKSALDLRLGVTVTAIRPAEQTVVLDDGDELSYDKLVIATGARARPLPVPGANLSGVHYLRDAADIAAIQAGLKDARSAVVIGGGYIGLEAAATMRKNGLDVTVLEAAGRVLARVTGEGMSAFFERLHREEGVHVRTSCQLDGFFGDETLGGVLLGDGEKLSAELAIVGIGVIPNTELAEAAGIVVDNGIVTDEFGRTSAANIFAIGDCANSFHPRYARHLRLESVQNANDQALNVAGTICDQAQPYSALPWFWSDQFDIKLQIAGLQSSTSQEIWRGDASSGRQFAVCYVDGDRLVALDALNSPKDFVAARKLIESETRFDLAKLADATISLGEAAL